MNFLNHKGEGVLSFGLIAIAMHMVALTSACAERIEIVNPSFELDSIEGSNAPVFEVMDKQPPEGWENLPSEGAAGGIIAPSAAENQFYNRDTPGIDGSKAFFVVGNGGIQQVLTATLTPNTTYTLSVLSGTRANGAVFGGYQITLDTVSGNVIGTWTGVHRNIAPASSFSPTVRSFTTGPNPPGKGEKLRITLNQPFGGGGYTDLDNVSLNATPVTPRAAGTPIDVFLVAGQSNAHGWAVDRSKLSEENRPYADAPDPNALLIYRQRNLPDPMTNVGSLARLSTQGAGFGGTYDGFGPELSMGTDIAKAVKKPIAILKYAIGSAGLAAHFRKTDPFDPDPARHLYGEMIAFIQKSLQELRDQGYSPAIKALFWLQGETDTDREDIAKLYQENVTQFIADLRKDLAAPDMKVFLTEINKNTPNLSSWADKTAWVNDGMHECAGLDPKVQVVTTGDIVEGFADGIHYSADQTIDIGQRWAAAYLAAP